MVTFIVPAWTKTIPLKFHTAKQVKNFTHQINDNLNKNLLKKPHHHNTLGPGHLSSQGCYELKSASRFPTTRGRNMFPWLRWHRKEIMIFFFCCNRQTLISCCDQERWNDCWPSLAAIDSLSRIISVLK